MSDELKPHHELLEDAQEALKGLIKRGHGSSLKARQLRTLIARLKILTPYVNRLNADCL